MKSSVKGVQTPVTTASNKTGFEIVNTFRRLEVSSWGGEIRHICTYHRNLQRIVGPRARAATGT